MTRHGTRDERGSMSVEVVLLAPIMLMLVLLVVLCGRWVTTEGDVDAAARDAARAASLQVTRSEAVQAANEVVERSLSGDTTCQPPVLSGTWEAGGRITVTLDCQVSYQGLGLLGVPGHADIGSSSVVPLDPYRRYR